MKKKCKCDACEVTYAKWSELKGKAVGMSMRQIRAALKKLDRLAKKKSTIVIGKAY